VKTWISRALRASPAQTRVPVPLRPAILARMLWCEGLAPVNQPARSAAWRRRHANVPQSRVNTRNPLEEPSKRSKIRRSDLQKGFGQMKICRSDLQRPCEQ
jgi:hypothetical protein